MNREIVGITHLEDWQSIAYGCGLEGFHWIQEKQIYFDSEKAYADFEVILQRESDDKYFKGKFSKWSAGGREVQQTITEVFPKQITTTIYE